MLARALPRLLTVILPLIVLFYLLSRTSNVEVTTDSSDSTPPSSRWKWIQSSNNATDKPKAFTSTGQVIPPSHLVTVDDHGEIAIDHSAYTVLVSNSTHDGKYFHIKYGKFDAYNPNIVAHPTRHDAWIVVAQQEQSREQYHTITQLVCAARFVGEDLTCVAEPTKLDIDNTEGHCTGDLEYFNYGLGPRDARAFQGPDAPYILYGSQATYTCLGVWMQDLRLLVKDYKTQSVLAKSFRQGTEVQRPPPVHGLEKNFFIFWDMHGEMYVHYDIYPQRTFAKLNMDGSVGPDLAPLAAKKDAISLSKFMPKLPPEHAAIHQASNTISITMCKRADPTCKPTEKNTFIMTIFQYKSFFDFHGVYEPYVMLFQQHLPFAIHAISAKPFWITGRAPFSKATGSITWLERNDLPENHSEMIYVTSISWKTHGQRYHGYLDDIMFVGFGIEDTRPAAIDIVAEDLLKDLNYC